MPASREVITCLSVRDLCESCLEFRQLAVEDEEITAVYFVLVILLHSMESVSRRINTSDRTWFFSIHIVRSSPWFFLLAQRFKPKRSICLDAFVVLKQTKSKLVRIKLSSSVEWRRITRTKYTAAISSSSTVSWLYSRQHSQRSLKSTERHVMMFLEAITKWEKLW